MEFVCPLPRSFRAAWLAAGAHTILGWNSRRDDLGALQTTDFERCVREYGPGWAKHTQTPTPTPSRRNFTLPVLPRDSIFSFSFFSRALYISVIPSFPTGRVLRFSTSRSAPHVAFQQDNSHLHYFLFFTVSRFLAQVIDHPDYTLLANFFVPFRTSFGRQGVE